MGEAVWCLLRVVLVLVFPGGWEVTSCRLGWKNMLMILRNSDWRCWWFNSFWSKRVDIRFFLFQVWDWRYQIFYEKKRDRQKLVWNWIGLHGTTPSKKNKLDGGLVDWQSGEDLSDKLSFFFVFWKTQFENTTSEVLSEFFRWRKKYQVFPTMPIQSRVFCWIFLRGPNL